MPKIVLTSPIFDKAKRSQAFSNFVGKQAKDFKVLTRDRMVQSLASGRLYSRKGGFGFRRKHRASAPGQRPSPDSFTLVNAVAERDLSPLHSQVYIADVTNPANGTIASKYAEILQTKLSRPIMSSADAVEAQVKMTREADVVIKALI